MGESYVNYVILTSTTFHKKIFESGRQEFRVQRVLLTQIESRSAHTTASLSRSWALQKESLSMLF